MYFPNILPALPTVLNNLDAQVNAMKETATVKQRVVAAVTSTVAVATIAAVDAVFHAACLSVKTLPALFKVTVGAWTGLDKYVPAACSGKQWLAHAYKIDASFVMMIEAAKYLLTWNAGLLINNARTIGLMNVIPDAPAGKSVAGVAR